ncbi:MAG: hypothetical protein ACYDH6_13310 [Acidimicrobiales bacterium]
MSILSTSELVDVRADGICPGESICLGGSLILVTAVEAAAGVVDLHTEYGPALRFVSHDMIPVAVAADAMDAA